jgi:hypothetical protein
MTGLKFLVSASEVLFQSALINFNFATSINFNFTTSERGHLEERRGTAELAAMAASAAVFRASVTCLQTTGLTSQSAQSGLRKGAVAMDFHGGSFCKVHSGA